MKFKGKTVIVDYTDSCDTVKLTLEDLEQADEGLISKSWSSFRDNFHLFQRKTDINFHISIFSDISVYIKYRSVIQLVTRFRKPPAENLLIYHKQKLLYYL